MTADLTKLDFFSGYPAFKNNNKFDGSFNITGSTAGGTNVRTTTVNLGFTPDMVDIIFTGQAADVFGLSASDPRPTGAWFKNGAVWARGDNAGAGYNNYGTYWIITSKILGSSMVITATYTQQFSDALTLTSTPVSYRLVDYSVF